ncbi:DNA topology modulation protein FlaR [Pseudalkalibacillus sp. Hm43]|uniref:DNA topology modulation protein FlaR n=1 Tax=Pseudalkalibacillus sp. Hm43 TaxID=3450742 RepID=UPI003F43C9EE
MNDQMKIHIIGSVGSGKTIFARKLSSVMGIPFYEIDNVVWDRSGTEDVRHPEKERNRQFAELISKEEWIIEGAQYGWTSEGFRRADLIIMLYPHLWIRNYRILRRYVRFKLGYEQLNYKHEFRHLFKLYKWNYKFEYRGKDDLLEQFASYEQKLVILKNNKEIERFLDETRNRKE